MGALIVTIITTILACTDVIPSNLAIAIIFGSLIWMLVGSGLYFKFGFLKFYYHDLLGWHTPDDSPQWSDGCNQHATCKYCKKEIMQDSQGNWF